MLYPLIYKGGWAFIDCYALSVGDDHRIIAVLDVVLIEFLILFALRIFHHGAFVGKAVDASAPTAMDEGGILRREF